MTKATFKSERVTIIVDHDRCKGHGDCADNCPGEVYDIVDNKAVAARIDDCVECCACVESCPETAIDHSSCL